LIDDFPNNPHYKRELAMIFAFTSRPPDGGQQTPRSIERLTRAVAMMEALVDAYPDVPEYRWTLAFCYHALAGGFWRQGEVDEATEHCRRSVALSELLVEEFPGVPRYRGHLLRALDSLAGIYRQRSQPEQARQILERMIHVAGSISPSEAPGPRNQFLAAAYADLAEVLAELGEPAQAEQARLKAKQYGPPPPRRPGFFLFGPPGPKAEAKTPPP